MKPIKFVACGDIHGDEQDAPSVKALLAFTKEYQPDLVVCIGDLWDFRAIRKGAGDEEQASSLQKDWDCGVGLGYIPVSCCIGIRYCNQSEGQWRRF